MKIALIIFGVIVTLMGFACTAAGGTLLGVAGADGWVESDTDRLDSSTYAVVSEAAEIDVGTGDGADLIGKFHVRIEAEPTANGGDVFIGVGPSEDVERYLASVEYDTIKDVEFDGFVVGGFDVKKNLVPGTRAPAAPASQNFWRASATGAGKQSFDWKFEDGSYRFVVMNADATKGVDVQASAAVKIPWVGPIAITLIVTGVIGLIGGVTLVVLAARSAAKPNLPVPAADPSAPA